MIPVNDSGSVFRTMLNNRELNYVSKYKAHIRIVQLEAEIIQHRCPTLCVKFLINHGKIFYFQHFFRPKSIKVQQLIIMKNILICK